MQLRMPSTNLPWMERGKNKLILNLFHILNIQISHYFNYVSFFFARKFYGNFLSAWHWLHSEPAGKWRNKLHDWKNNVIFWGLKTQASFLCPTLKNKTNPPHIVVWRRRPPSLIVINYFLSLSLNDVINSIIFLIAKKRRPSEGTCLWNHLGPKTWVHLKKLVLWDRNFDLNKIFN